jgi:chromosome segregation ATPase
MNMQAARPSPVSDPFKAPDIVPVPSVPEAGLLAAVKYTIAFGRARWQRRGAIGDLRDQISKDTGILDGILGTLGRQTRSLGIENKALEFENKAIDGAEERRRSADHACSELSNRQAEENSKFADLETEREGKVADADRALDTAQTELSALEEQRRDLRDQRKTIESRQKGYLKAADGRDADSEKQESRERRDELRAAAASLRRDAELLSQERQDVDRRYDALEPSLNQLSSRVDALKSDRDAAKRGLTDLREGHRHRLAEIDAEQGRKSRELAQAEAEIERRYVTLGTLVNLNRIERDEFVSLYEQIDTLRGAIGARSHQIDKLSAERQAFDKASLIRGACVLGGGFLLFLALLAILLTAT